MESEKEKHIREAVAGYDAQMLERTPVAIALTLDQLLMAIRQLDQSARVEVVHALEEMNTELDAQLDAFIHRLAEREPADDVTDEMNNAEVRAVRAARMESGNYHNADVWAVGWSCQMTSLHWSAPDGQKIFGHELPDCLANEFAATTTRSRPSSAGFESAQADFALSLQRHPVARRLVAA